MPESRIAAGLCAAAFGAVMVCGMAPWHCWPLLFIGFSLFYMLLTPVKTFRGGLALGWCFGFGYFCAGLWWIANALLVDGNAFRWVWPFTIAGLPALLAFFPAIACGLCARFTDRRRLDGFIAFIIAIAASEWLRGHILTGLPWNLYGYTWGGWLAMAQSAALGGSYFMTLLTVFWAVLPGFLFIWPAPRRSITALLFLGLATFAANITYGELRLSRHPTELNRDVAVRPVQANITQADKWNPDKTADNLNRMLAASLPDLSQPEAPLTLIVWPETALEYDVLANDDARALIREMLSHYKNTVYLMTGLLRYEGGPDGKGQYFNSFAVLDRSLNLHAVYNKSHLVPFGEYIPLHNILPMNPFVSFQDFTPGEGVATMTVNGVPPFSPLVCYEVIFPGAVTAEGGIRPDWLVNITNDAWYGDSPGPRQHFAQTRFRAIEEGLPMVRAAETGISGVIDPLGRTVYLAPLNMSKSRTVSLPRPLARPTLYAREGDTLFFLCLAFSVVILFFLQRRRRTSLTPTLPKV